MKIGRCYLGNCSDCGDLRGPHEDIKESKGIEIETIKGDTHRFSLDRVSNYDFEFTPAVLRIDFKNGTFIEYTRQNILYARIYKGAIDD